MSEWTKERIDEYKEVYKNAQTPVGAMAGYDGCNLVGCYGYHDEIDEYEYGCYARFGNEQDAMYANIALSRFPDALDEIERLQSEVATLRSQLKETETERDLAIAHDTQPYPTADAYDKVCMANESKRVEIGKLRSQRDRLIEAGSPCVMFYSLQSGNNSDEVADWRALVDEITAED